MFKNKFKKLTSIFLVMVLAFSVSSQAYAMDNCVEGLFHCCSECCRHFFDIGDGEVIERADIYSEDRYSEQNIFDFDKKTGHLIIGKDIETKRLKDIVNIPSKLDEIRTVTIGNGVTKICKEAFKFYDNPSDLGYYKNFLTKITIPNSVTSIGAYAFSGCYKLKEITIPSSVTTIGGEAFYSCPSLESINVNEENPNYKSIDGILFSKDGTKLCKYPQGKGNCTNIYTIPIGVKKIGSSAFEWCTSLKEITIPNSVTEIGDYAFDSCKSLTSVNIPEGITRIGNRTFSECRNLPEITIPKSITEIGNYAFSGCESLQEIKIPEGVRKISEGSFNSCKNLGKVSIPSSVKEIGIKAFYNCVYLRKVFIPYPKFVSTYESSFGSCPYLRIIDCIEAEKEENSSDPM